MNDFVPNTLLLVLEIFRTNIFLATHFETNCSFLLSIAVISVAVVAADVYSVESFFQSRWHDIGKD